MTRAGPHNERGERCAPRLALGALLLASACSHDLNRSWDAGAREARPSDQILAWPDLSDGLRPACLGLEGCPTGTHCCSGSCTKGPGVCTLAGSGLMGAPDAPLAAALVNGAQSMLADGKGNLFFTEWPSAGVGIRLLNSGATPLGPVPAGSVGRIAGGRLGCRPGPALEAELRMPTGLARDPQGNLYIADRGCAVVWKLSADFSTLSLLAGSPGINKVENGVGPAARFQSPQGLAYSAADGHLYLSELESNLIRRVTLAGEVTTVAGNGAAGTVDGPAPNARFRAPAGIAADAKGTLFVGQWEGGAVRKISAPIGPTSVVSTILPEAGDRSGLATMTLLPAGQLLFHSWSAGLRRLTPPPYTLDQLTLFQARISEAYDPSLPTSVWLGGWIHVPIPSSAANTISRYDLNTKQASVVAGRAGVLGVKDGAGAAASFALAEGGGIAVDGGGAVWVAEHSSARVRRIGRDGTVTSFGSGEMAERGGTAATAAFHSPSPIATRGSEVFVVGRHGGYRITKIDAKGVVTLLGSACLPSGECAQAAPFAGLVGDGAGNLFLSVQVTVNLTSSTLIRPGILKIAGSGTGGSSFLAGGKVAGCTDGAAGTFSEPLGLARDDDGTLYVADRVCGVRKLGTDGKLSTLSKLPAIGVALRSAPAKLLYVSAEEHLLHVIELASGAVRPFAGGPVGYESHHRDGDLASARFWKPAGLAVDATGAIFVLDSANNMIRVVYP